jgi:prophage regulatory protein
MSKVDRLLRRTEVERLVGLKRSAIYEMVGAVEFPRPVKLSARAVAWRESEVAAWISSREAA